LQYFYLARFCKDGALEVSATYDALPGIVVHEEAPEGI
jgi:hypothetical protein